MSDTHPPDSNTLEENQNIPAVDVAKVQRILDAIEGEGLDVGSFLVGLFGYGPNSPCRSSQRLALARGKLFDSPLIRVIFENWLTHPVKYKGPKAVLLPEAFRICTAILSREVSNMDKRMAVGSIDTKRLIECDFADLRQWLESADGAPHLWHLLYELSTTARGRSKNTQKSPDMMIVFIISQLSFSRSSSNHHIAQVMTIFFKAIGLPTRGFEVLHKLGICMSQKSGDRFIEVIAQQTLDQLIRDIQIWASAVSGDNVNITSKVFSQRLSNQNRFESGTAATVYIFPRPPLPKTVGEEYRRLAATHDYIGYEDFVNKEIGERIHLQKVNHVLRILLSSKFFNRDYEGRNHPSLAPPPAVRLIPKGSEYKLKQYMLPIMKIDQATHEGNNEWILAALHRCGLLKDGEEHNDCVVRLALEMLVAIIGDELTCNRIRALKQYKGEDENGFDRMDFVVEICGWFHALMCLAQSIYHIHFGSISSRGLSRDVSLLKRIHVGGGKGLGEVPAETAEATKKSEAPSKKKPAPLSAKAAAKISFHDLDEILHQTTEARVLTAWLHVAQIQSLEQLQTWNPTPDDLKELAEEIVRGFASQEALQTEPLEEPKTKSQKRPKARKSATLDVKAEERQSSDTSSESQSEDGGTDSADEADDEAQTPEERQKTLFENNVRYLRDVLLYYELRAAIREGDTGRMEDLVPVLALMFKGGGHPKYGVQMLEVMQGLKYEYPEELANFVRDFCWLITRNGFTDCYPIDKGQEMNNLHSKVTYDAQGQNASWEYLAKISPVVPVFRDIKATLEKAFPSTINGTAHSSPDKWADIRALVNAYQDDQITSPNLATETTLSRSEVDPTNDILQEGFKALHSGKWIEEWKERRSLVKRATNQSFNDNGANASDQDTSSVESPAHSQVIDMEAAKPLGATTA